MTWMLTATGTGFDLRCVAQESIDIHDIAHQLAQINRFNGAASRPYSVAEHSLLVVEILERERQVTNPGVLLAALLHDAHEAYTGDLSSPMKRLIGEAWQREEDRMQLAVMASFSLRATFADKFGLIDWADKTALACERRDLMPPSGPAWQVLRDHPPLDWVRLAEQAGYDWTYWRRRYTARFAALHHARRIVGRQMDMSLRARAA